MYDHVSVQHFERAGRLVSHGDTDRLGRPDAIEFVGRSGQRLVDWLGEVTVWIDRWPTRTGVAVLLERADALWVPCANALPFDGIYVTRETPAKLVFSSYVELTAAATYRLFLPAAVLTRDTLTIGALQRYPDGRPAPRLRRHASKSATPPVRKAS